MSKELNRLKDILNNLGYLRLYFLYIRNTNKKDNITNIKSYFNNNIFISIIDYKMGNLDKLFLDQKSFNKYMNNNPDKIVSKYLVKQEKTFRIFLR